MKKREVRPGAVPAPPGNGEFSLIPHHKLLALYAVMLKCRMFARRIPGLPGRSNHISEAVAAGVTIDLLAADVIGPAPGDPLPCLVKGVALKSLLRRWRNPSGRIPAAFIRANVIPPPASCGARLEAALRLAAYFKSAATGSVAVFFAGPDSPRSKAAGSSTLSPAQLESFLRSAASNRLPILIVKQSGINAEGWTSFASQCGVPGMVVDRDDAVAVYRVTFEALAHARAGNGPTLIECRPWRLEGRAGKSREVRGCIHKMEVYLAGKGISSQPVKAKVTRGFAVELDRAIRASAGASYHASAT